MSMLILDQHIYDGALTPRQGHEQCEGGPSLFPTERYLFIYLFIYLTRIGEFILIRFITTKIPCTRHGVSLVVRVVSAEM